VKRRYFRRCSCGRPIPEGVTRCSSRTRPEYAPAWARDTRRRLMENLRIVPLTVMFSVTAPGADLYPFDSRFCSHSPSQRCSGAAAVGLIRSSQQHSMSRSDAGGVSYIERRKVRADRATGHKGRILARVFEAEAGHQMGRMTRSAPRSGAGMEELVERRVPPDRLPDNRGVATRRRRIWIDDIDPACARVR
jgi:hypothetical protein